MTNLALRFAPNVWAKLLYLCKLGDTEIGGFGVSHPEDPLYIIGFEMVKQTCTAASIKFDDTSVNDYYLRKAEEGFEPAHFARIWIHTHPGSSPSPSGTDENTFKEVFGQCDWAIMFIMARDGSTYARMKINHAIAGAVDVSSSASVDFLSRVFEGSDFDAWKAEYETNVQKEVIQVSWPVGQSCGNFDWQQSEWYEKYREAQYARENLLFAAGREVPDDVSEDPTVVNAFLQQEQRKTDIVPVEKKSLLQKKVSLKDGTTLHGESQGYSFLDKKLKRKLDRMDLQQTDLLIYEIEKYKGLGA